MSDTISPAEVFPPSEYLRDELEARDWSISEFAEILGRPVQTISEILNNRKEITPETATEIAAALGTDAEVWLNLQTAYRLYQLRGRAGRQTAQTAVERRAKLRSLVPLAELKKLTWLPDTKDLDRLEAAVRKLLRISTLDEPPRWTVAARRSNPDVDYTPAQNAWLGRASSLAATRKLSASFDQDGLATLGAELGRRLADPAELPRTRRWLAEVGVALVVVPHLQGSKIDGAVLLDPRPTIALSLRGNRFDTVVFTLLHEIAHLVRGHVAAGAVLDEELGSTDEPGAASTSRTEVEANEYAESWLFPHGLNLDQPVTERKVIATAETLGVHPSLVVGHLQHHRLLGWNSPLRRLVPSAKSLLPFD